MDAKEVIVRFAKILNVRLMPPVDVHPIHTTPLNLNRKNAKILFKLHDDLNFQLFESSLNNPFPLCPREAFEYGSVHRTCVTLSVVDCKFAGLFTIFATTLKVE